MYCLSVTDNNTHNRNDNLFPRQTTKKKNNNNENRNITIGKQNY